MNRLFLDGNDWKLIYVKNDKFQNDGITADVSLLKTRGYDEIDAIIPGNLEIDLERAGKIDNPFFADNHYSRRCEYLHCIYTKEFVYDGSMQNPELVFEGIDTIADIYLNNTLIGSTDNMLIAHHIEPSKALVVGTNIITVHIKPAVIEARKYEPTVWENAAKDNYESLHIRKASHMYSWDIMPRMVSAGIWKSVYLKERKRDRITEFYGYTLKADPVEKKAELHFLFDTVLSADECMDYSLVICGECGDSTFTFKTKLRHTYGHYTIEVDNAKLWWPRFNGEQNLYQVKASLIKDDTVLDEYNTKMGIRTVKLNRTSVVSENGSEFCFIVNGKRIFAMGSNWVPVDALHSRDVERLPEILPMLTDINCNIIRMWGGNVYENDMLYDFCDENGIMIWQDFAMACALYPQERVFQDKLYKEAVWVIKHYRQHPSIVLWAGDNENDLIRRGDWGEVIGSNPNENVLTRKVLFDAVRIHDNTRPYIPSSPYVDEEAYITGKSLSEDHLWGPRDYFKGPFYTSSVCHFASETGYYGCPSPKSIRKFIPEDYVWTTTSADDWEGIENKMWLAHSTSMESADDVNNTCRTNAYRIRMMYNHVTTLFGDTVPCTLDDFAKASQISQAEGKKYFIERFRINKGEKSGIIWWNLIDGWPQFSDAVVDYYFTKKLAYHYIKRSQNPICLMFDEPKNNIISLYAVNEFSRDEQISYTITDLTEGKLVGEGLVMAKASSSACVFSMSIEPEEKHFYLIEWEINGKKYSNHFMTNIRDINYPEYLEYLAKCGYLEYQGFNN